MSKAIIGLALSLALALASEVTAQDSGKGQKCGVPQWSIADQRQVVMPCTAPAATEGRNEGGSKQSCGVPVWSIAEQRQTVLPCVDPAATQPSGPHIGE